MRRCGVVVIVGLLLGAVTPMHAQNVRCDGTLLELAVVEEGTSETDRFQFALRLEAQATSKKDALNELKRRLGTVRRKMSGLAMGGLIVSAPRTHTVGSTTAAPQRYHATTAITGEVSRSNYDPLIQQAGHLLGVSLQGMTSLSSIDGARSLQQQLFERALATGRRQAQSTQQLLGLSKIRLIRIDRRSGGGLLRTSALSRPEKSFDPSEAPKPRQSIRLNLDYCLN
jgi:uncharacterized protein YggE